MSPHTRYEVFNIRTQAVVRVCRTLKGARRAVDRLDNAWGGYAHIARAKHCTCQECRGPSNVATVRILCSNTLAE